MPTFGINFVCTQFRRRNPTKEDAYVTNGICVVVSPDEIVTRRNQPSPRVHGACVAIFRRHQVRGMRCNLLNTPVARRWDCHVNLFQIRTATLG